MLVGSFAADAKCARANNSSSLAVTKPIRRTPSDHASRSFDAPGSYGQSRSRHGASIVKIWRQPELASQRSSKTGSDDRPHNGCLCAATTNAQRQNHPTSLTHATSRKRSHTSRLSAGRHTRKKRLLQQSVWRRRNTDAGASKRKRRRRDI